MTSRVPWLAGRTGHRYSQAQEAWDDGASRRSERTLHVASRGPGHQPLSENDWTLTYEDNGATVLVLDMNGLMQHLMQEPDFDGNLAGALDTFMATPMAGNMPPHIRVELRNAGIADGNHERELRGLGSSCRSTTSSLTR